MAAAGPGAAPSGAPSSRPQPAPLPRGPRPWRQAWADGAATFYGGGAAPGGSSPAEHFATAVNDGDAMARLVMIRLAEVDDRLGRPPQLDLVDVGCGGGELLVDVHRLLDCPLAAAHRWATRLRLRGVELRPRPPELPATVDWVVGAAPEAVPHGVRGLILAHELLDDVPCDVLECDGDGVLREVLVDDVGHELLGEALADGDPRATWLRRWWPLSGPGRRAEVGRTRDEVVVALAGRLDEGALVVVDYAHTRSERAGEHAAVRWRRGSLTGYVRGRRVAPVPDGSMNLTAHVALDACAAALAAAAPDAEVQLSTVAGAVAGLTRQQRETTTPPGASSLRRTALDSRWRTLADPRGWGGFGLLELRRTP